MAREAEDRPLLVLAVALVQSEAVLSAAADDQVGCHQRTSNTDKPNSGPAVSAHCRRGRGGTVRRFHSQSGLRTAAEKVGQLNWPTIARSISSTIYVNTR